MKLGSNNIGYKIRKLAEKLTTNSIKYKKINLSCPRYNS